MRRYRPYLFRYDYGGGSVYAFIRAPDVESVLARYPYLEYMQDFPAYFTVREKEIIRKKETYVLGSVRSGWLFTLSKERDPYP